MNIGIRNRTRLKKKETKRKLKNDKIEKDDKTEKLSKNFPKSIDFNYFRDF